MRRVSGWIFAGLFILVQHSLAANASDEALIYSFLKNSSDGQIPDARLFVRNGKLYGTTFGGGSDHDGTVFSIDLATGVETVLHAFTGEPDGATPLAGLILFDGKLYGTTWGGGNVFESGTIFAIDPANGDETVVYTFSGQHGAHPAAELLAYDGVLYGTTSAGGYYLEGTVFAFDPTTRQVTVLHAFSGDCYGGGGGDACEPSAPLIQVGGILYGATSKGGLYDYGTVYSVDPSTHKESVLYSSTGSPYGRLVEFGGKLYGAEYIGGISRNGDIFSFDPSTGGEKTIYSFKGGSDGLEPIGSLINVGGVLYGTTLAGGSGYHGTVFRINSAGAKEVLHAFVGGSKDGGRPAAGLISLDSELYGTTQGGGAHGVGTVFEVAQQPRESPRGAPAIMAPKP